MNLAESATRATQHAVTSFTRRSMSRTLFLLLLIPLLHTAGPATAAQGDSAALGDSTQAAGPDQVEIILQLQEQASCPGEANLHARPLGPAVRATETVEGAAHTAAKTTAVPVPGRVVLQLDSKVPWELGVEIPACWAAAEQLPAGSRAGSYRMRIYTAGELRGKLQPPANEALPQELTLRFSAAARVSRAQDTPSQVRRNQEPRGSESCPVAPDGSFLCLAPAHSLDLRLHAEGYVPHYRWAVRPARDEAIRLGTLQLVRGATLAGWVRNESGLPPQQPGAKVRLRPQGWQEDPLQEQRAGRLVREVRSDQRGFFQLSDLPAGAFELSIRAEGFATLHQEPILIREDRLLELSAPLVLHRPLTLEVQVEPARDLGDRPWRMHLQQPDKHRAVGHGQTDENGLWRLPKLDPGSYMLLVEDGTGSRLHHEFIELIPGQTRVELRLPAVWVEGELSLGDEPLAARLAFGGRSGLVSIVMESDDEGRFAGRLPRGGEWAVDVESSEPPVMRRLQAVEVDAEEGDVAELQIRLPGTLLQGEVVDQEGRPLETASVLLIQVPAYEKPSFRRVDGEGQFAFHGLEPATYRVEARAFGPQGEAASPAVDVALMDRQEAPHLRLVVQPSLTVRGVVRSPSGPVPGAQLSAGILAAPGSGNGLVPTATSGSDGRFELRVPHGTQSLDLKVMAAGHLLHRTLVPVEDGRPLALDLKPGPGATLRLELQPEDFQLRLGQPPPQITQDATYKWSLGDLRRWAGLHGQHLLAGVLEVPGLPQGSYQICWPQAIEGKDGNVTWSKNPPCEGVYLQDRARGVFIRPEATHSRISTVSNSKPGGTKQP